MYLAFVVEEVVVLVCGLILLPLLLRRLAVNRRPLEIVLLVNLDVTGERVPNHHHVGFDIIHGDAVHGEVLRKQGLSWGGKQVKGVWIKICTA